MSVPRRRVLLLLLVAASMAATVHAQSYAFPWGGGWTYLDTGVDISATAWQSYFFSDTTWKSGYGPFAVGTPATTTLTQGPNSARFIPYYFRKVQCGGRMWGGVRGAVARRFTPFYCALTPCEECCPAEDRRLDSVTVFMYMCVHVSIACGHWCGSAFL